MRESSNIFCPEISLYTFYILLFFRSKGSRHRLIAVHPFHRQITSDTERFILSIFSLIIIKIQISVRGHDHIMFLLGSFNTSTFATPWHNCCIRSKSAFENLIPTDNLTSVIVQELLYMIDNETLQTFFLTMILIRFQAQRFDTCLTFRTFLPSYLRTFVTTYMDILWREDFNQFAIYIFQEFQNLIVAGTKYIIGYSPLSPNFIRSTGTTQFRISGKGSQHVSRKVNLRNNSDITFCGIIYNFLSLFLCIESTIGCIVIFTGVTSDDRSRSLRTYFRQLRIFLDFQTPSLIVSDMPVQTVHVV